MEMGSRIGFLIALFLPLATTAPAQEARPLREGVCPCMEDAWSRDNFTPACRKYQIGSDEYAECEMQYSLRDVLYCQERYGDSAHNYATVGFYKSMPDGGISYFRRARRAQEAKLNPEAALRYQEQRARVDSRATAPDAASPAEEAARWEKAKSNARGRVTDDPPPQAEKNKTRDFTPSDAPEFNSDPAPKGPPPSFLKPPDFPFTNGPTGAPPK